ncbi:MAG: hypothetical protein PHU14_14285 [Methylovulum sp.]|nr:hypothetical protein [Methylovulum sp.]
MTHWLHDWVTGWTAAVMESIKPALENRVWFNYPGQLTPPIYTGSLDTPTATARVLDDGTTQLAKATYNWYGKPLKETDPQGRVTRFTYDTNGVDLTLVQQQTNASGTFVTVAGVAYNSQHLPQTYTDAAGKLWNLAYNAAGQLIYATNPLNQTRFWEYDTQGRLVKTTIPKSVAFSAVVYGTTNTGLAAAETRNYTQACTGIKPPANTNLPISVTDSGGRKLCFQYDALDRVTQIKYPDGTADMFNYTFPDTWPVVAARGKPSLDLWQVTDRLGRVTTFNYDQNRRRTAVTEPVTVDGVGTARTTHYEY